MRTANQDVEEKPLSTTFLIPTFTRAAPNLLLHEHSHIAAGSQFSFGHIQLINTAFFFFKVSFATLCPTIHYKPSKLFNRLFK